MNLNRQAPVATHLAGTRRRERTLLTHPTAPLPDLTRQIAEHLHHSYGLRTRRVTLVPGRLHAEAAAYRIDCDDESYFLKLSPPPPPRGLTLARYLADAGIGAVPAPMLTREGERATSIGMLSATLYPFVEGENGFQRPLTAEQWRALGAAVRAVHAVEVPGALSEGVRTETYSDVFRRKVRNYLRLNNQIDGDAVALDLMELLSNRRDTITALVEHSEELAASVQRSALPLVPCHGDLHAGNVLVGSTSVVFIVDWDDPVLAPKERDLMFVGAGIGGVWNLAHEAAAFYDGYGATSVDAQAVAYYRCERIVEDVAVFCDQLLAGAAEEDGTVRTTLLQKLAAAFAPNDVVEIAERTFAAL